MPHSVLFEELSKCRVAGVVVDDHIIFENSYIFRHRNRQVPETRIVESRASVESRKLSKVIDHGSVGGELECCR